MIKKALCLLLAALFIAAALASCAVAPTGSEVNANIRLTSSDALDAAAWLGERLGEKLTNRVVIGTDASAYGVDTSALESDGFLIRACGGEYVLFAQTPDGLDRAVRKYAKMVETGAVTDATYHEGYRVKSLTVCGEDISAFAVVTDDDDEYCQSFAASELVSYIEKACGAKLATYTAAQYDALEAKPKAIRLTTDYPALGDEAFRITVAADGVTIAGGRYRGCMYGVYDLLEDIGWRFVNSPVDGTDSLIEYLYENEHVDLSTALSREEHPAIGFRKIHGGTGSGANGNIGAKYRVSAAAFGYGLTDIACHGIEHFTSELKDAGLYSGKGQPCYTDPDVIDLVTELTLERVKNSIKGGAVIGRDIVTVDVAQYDNGGFCRCKRCEKAVKLDGSDTGPVLAFTNAVADALAKNYPGVFASMLAYAGTNMPPLKTKPLDNVRISYCIYVGQSSFACSNHSVSGDDCLTPTGITNKKFGNELKGWAAICNNNNLDVWYYPFTCYGWGFDSPIIDQVYESMKWLTSLGCVNGMMFHSNTGTGVVLHSLISYVGSKLMWDGDMTKDEYDACVKEWFDVCYGESSDYIYPYFRQCVIAGDRMGCWCSYFTANDQKVDNEYMAEHFDKWWEDFNLALAAAESTAEYQFVERYMGGMLYICCGITYDERYTNGDETSRAAFIERYSMLYAIFKKYNIRVYDDFGSVDYVPEVFDPEASPFTWPRNNRR